MTCGFFSVLPLCSPSQLSFLPLSYPPLPYLPLMPRGRPSSKKKVKKTESPPWGLMIGKILVNVAINDVPRLCVNKKKGKRKASCYIASEAGCDFTVYVAQLGKKSPPFAAYLSLDGSEPVADRVVGANSAGTFFDSVVNLETKTERSLHFSELQLKGKVSRLLLGEVRVPDCLLLEHVAEDNKIYIPRKAGEIRIDIWEIVFEDGERQEWAAPDGETKERLTKDTMGVETVHKAGFHVTT